MDESDVAESPFEEELRPAVRRLREDERHTDGRRDSPFEEELRPAVRRIDEGDEAPALSDAEAVPDPSELAGPMQRLEPAIQPVWILQSAITAAILGFFGGVAFSVLPVGDASFGGGIFVLVFIFGAIHSVLRYRIWRFQVREDSLYLERGVFRRVRTVVPYVRIQHVDVSRGPIERVFGLATTVVYTAGSRGADVSIPGLTPERADDLQKRLKQLAIAAEGDDAV